MFIYEDLSFRMCRRQNILFTQFASSVELKNSAAIPVFFCFVFSQLMGTLVSYLIKKKRHEQAGEIWKVVREVSESEVGKSFAGEQGEEALCAEKRTTVKRFSGASMYSANIITLPSKTTLIST